MGFCEQNFFGTFFGKIMTCQSSEFTENMFFSLRRLAWLKENCFFID